MARKNKRKKKKRAAAGLFITALLLAGAAAGLLMTPPFNISSVKVHGNERILTEDIIGASGVRVGRNIFRTSMKNAGENVAQLPFVDSVKASRRLPATVEITITEGSVAAYLEYYDMMIGIDINGKTLETISHESAEQNKIMIEGVTVRDFKIGKKIVVDAERKFDIMTMYLKLFAEKELLPDITGLDLAMDDAISFTYKKRLIVKFGGNERADYKINCFEEILGEIGDGAGGLINMENLENVTYRESIE